MSTLAASHVTVSYGRGRRRVTALRDFTVEVPAGASIGLAGESGSGKTTAARVLTGLVAPVAGAVTWAGAPLGRLPGRGPGSRPRAVQLVFQDPNASLNQRMTVQQTLAEARQVNDTTGEHSTTVPELLTLVGLNPDHADRYPFEFSGGQRQRIAIARALAVRPHVLIADELTSALDVSVQAAILNLLRRLRKELGLSLVVISHNLDVVRYLCDEVYVLYRARVVEHAATDSLFTEPRHPYTAALLDAVPRLGKPRARPPTLPITNDDPSGCVFAARCPHGPLGDPRHGRCVDEEPVLPQPGEERHRVACHYPLGGVEVPLLPPERG